MNTLQNLSNWMGLIGFVAMAAYVVFFQWKNQSVTLLRQQVNDMSVRITFLEDQAKAMQLENDGLKKQYEDVKFKKNYLKGLIMESLSKKKAVEISLLDELKEKTK